MENKLHIFKDESGNTTYVAPSNAEIRLKIFFPDENIPFSEPYLRYEQDMNSLGWDEFRNHCLSIPLGQYIHKKEIESLKDEIAELVDTACSGYHFTTSDESALLMEFAKEAIEEIKSLSESFIADLTFNEPSPTFDIFHELLAEDIDMGVSANSSNADLEDIALEMSEQTYPYMHPWNTFHELVGIRDALHTEEP